MGIFFSRHSIMARPMEGDRSHQWRHPFIAFTAFLCNLLLAAGLCAQPAGPAEPAMEISPVEPAVAVPDYCLDSCCRADVLVLNTGYDYAANGTYAIGSADAYWTIVGDQDPTRPVPRPANVIASHPVWSAAISNTQWIGANAGPDDQFVGQVTYEKCFCVCRETELTFVLDILTDDSASVYLDGVYQGSTTNPSFVTPSSVIFKVVVGPGRHCLDVSVDNLFVTAAGLDIQGTVQGPGLVKLTCCGPARGDTCEIERLDLATGPGWELTEGPEYAGPYPRCADVIDPPNEGWGGPIDGTTWIGPNPKGENRKGDEKYVYRKCFCVKEGGTFSIDMSVMADESATVLLDGSTVLKVPSPGWHNPTEGEIRIKLDPGCHCFDVIVEDCCGMVTGLDALFTIRGGLDGGMLLRPECCECDHCHQIEGRAGRHPDIGAVERLNVPAH